VIFLSVTTIAVTVIPVIPVIPVTVKEPHHG